MQHSVPVIDLAPWFSGEEASKNTVAEALREACQAWGFFLVEGHGLDSDLIELVRSTTRAFFDLPVDEKMKSDAAGRPGGRGYYGMETKSLARTSGHASAPADLREAFRMGLEAGSGPASAHVAANVWPAEPEAFKRLWKRYFQECGALAAEMMRICARALQLDDHWFDDKIDRPISNLMAQHYPAVTRSPLPGQLRSGAHTDFGTLTLLLAEDRPGGLQVQALDGAWHDVKPLPGTFIVNLGDMMSQWTNDRWRSTVHRVVNPPAGAGSSTRRLSVVYFHMPNSDAVIECVPTCSDASDPPRHAPYRVEDHLTHKLSRADSVAARTG